jgi:hypothetical protein
MKIKPVVIAANSSLLCFFATSYCLAQSTPSEFAQMSLQELFNQSIYDTEKQQIQISPWTLNYQYKTAKFEGYLDGSKSLSFNDVKGPPSNGSGKTFPVVPTTITQTAHIYSVGYQFNEQWQGHLSVPYIKQSTDHLSLVPGYSTFTINTDGIGDIVMSASYALNSESWLLSLGLSLPSGSIDEQGDTPRGPGNQQVPYTMQLGSGTYDFPVELSYQNSSAPNLSLKASATIRTGTNDRDYRLGNNYSLSGRYKVDLSSRLQSYVGLAGQYSDSIHGQDDSLLAGDPATLYPASITNPDLYGGKKISASLGLLWKITEGYQLNMELSKPIYQNLNGPQPKEKWRSSFYISKLL